MGLVVDVVAFGGGSGVALVVANNNNMPSEKVGSLLQRP